MERESERLFTSDEFREFLQELDSFYHVLDRHHYSSDVNLVESLSLRTEDYRECLCIMRDVALRVPSSPRMDEVVECVEELLRFLQDRLCTFLTFLETVEEDNTRSHPSIPNLSCTVYRSRRVQAGGGRPFTFISRTQLEAFIEMNFSFATIAKILCVSERTLLRRRAELGLPVGRQFVYSALDDSELDGLVSEIIQVRTCTSQNLCCTLIMWFSTLIIHV